MSGIKIGQDVTLISMVCLLNIERKLFRWRMDNGKLSTFGNSKVIILEHHEEFDWV